MKYIAVFDIPDETTPIDDVAELVCCGKVSEVYAKIKPLPEKKQFNLDANGCPIWQGDAEAIGYNQAIDDVCEGDTE